MSNPPVIFIVDDNPANVKVLSKVLESFGYKILIAMDGITGIAKITKAQPDLILLDILMPELDGFDTCKKLKESELTSEIPIIFMTALASTADKTKGLKLGAVDYVTKPFQQEELIARIELHLKLRRLSKSLVEQNQQLQSEIIQRQKAEERLRIFSRISEQSPASIVITNMEGNIEYVNPKFEQLTGYSLSDAIGKNPRILKSGFNANEKYVQLWDNITHEKEWHGELLNKKRNGELYWEQASISAIRDDDGNVTHYVAVKEDITLRKQKELEFRQQVEREQIVSRLILSIRQSLNLSAILNTATTELRKILEVDRVLVYSILPNDSGRVVAESVSGQLTPMLNMSLSEDIFPPEAHQGYIEGRIYQIDNLDQDTIRPCLQNFLQGLGIKAKLVAPIIQNDHLWGLLVAHHSQPHYWQAWETELFRQVCNPMAVAIDQASLYQQLQIELAEKKLAETALQRLNQELEDRVERRTSDLRQSEFRFRRLFESNAAGVFTCDLEGIVLSANNRFLEMIGYSLEDLHNRLINCCAITPLEFKDQDEKALQGIRDSGFNNPYEKEYICKDGQRLPVLLSGATIRQNEVICLAVDIRELKEAEEKLMRQAEREKSLREITQRIRQSLELPTIFQAVVHEVKQLLKVDRVSIFYFYPESQLQDGVFVAEELQDGFMNAFERTIQSSDFGKHFAVHYQSATTRMIADLDRAEVTESHRQILQQLEVKAEVVVPVLQGSHGEYLWGLLCIHQCSSPREWEQFEIDFLTQIVSQLAIAIQQADLYQRVQIELTERKQIEAQLQENNEKLAIANVELARATRLKDEFLANMSHELRTPLNAILGMSEALLEGVLGKLSDRQSKAISTVESSGQHLLALITDILDLAKVESGKLELHPENVEIKKLCNDSLSFVKQIAIKKEIQISLQLSERLQNNAFRHIQVDELRMRQILINLLTNAVKFTPEKGKVSLNVDITETNSSPPDLSANSPSQRSQYYIDFVVADTGIGIAPDDIGKLFQTFVQIDSALNRKYAGTGLGLSLVKKITEMHNGAVTVESEVGKGTQFRVRIPYQQDLVVNNMSQEVTSAVTESQNLETSNQELKPIAILLAEDNEANIESVRGYLESRGYKLSLAKNGQIAVDLAIAQKPDIILMDIQMPEMDGLTAIKIIRANPDVANIPIIALTGLAMTGDREKCLEAGANEYLSKPFRLRQLNNLIQDILKL